MRTARVLRPPSLASPGACTATLAGVDPASPDDRHLRYWRSNLRLTAALLAAWFVVTFVIGWFARELDFNFFGWPFSFWGAAQGALIVYVAIVWFYARRRGRLGRGHGGGEDREPPPATSDCGAP